MSCEGSNCRSKLPAFLGILGSFLVLAALVWLLQRYAQPAPLGAERAAERAKALVDLRAAEAQALTTPAWIDQGKGIVRLPIQTAIEMAANDWGRNPAAARSNLIARVAKATAEPPKAPEKKSDFE